MRAFPPTLYRDASALVAAVFHEDTESFEEILAEVGPNVARPLVEVLVEALGMLAERWEMADEEVIELVGLFAAEQSVHAP